MCANMAVGEKAFLNVRVFMQKARLDVLALLIVARR